MDIIFNPPINKENQYIQLLVKALRSSGYRIHSLDGVLSNFGHFKSIKLIHLNWFENVDDSSFFVAIKSFFRKLVVLSIIRISGKPLIWTMHNRASHEKGLSFFSRTITRLLMRWSHRIIIHTRQSEEILAQYGVKARQKAVYLPHPNFIGVYGDVQHPEKVDERKLQLLFIGMVKPYKNLELLMTVAGELANDVQLTITGKAINAEYERQVIGMASRLGNVAFIPGFIPDEEMALRLAQTDVLVLPYDLSSSLNSGTVLLAFSYGKTVICPEIGTIADLGERKEDTFHYLYGSDEEHYQALRRQLAAAVATKQQNPMALQAMGNRLFEYVSVSHNQKQIGQQLAEIYHKLIRSSR